MRPERMARRLSVAELAVVDDGQRDEGEGHAEEIEEQRRDVGEGVLDEDEGGCPRRRRRRGAGGGRGCWG